MLLLHVWHVQLCLWMKQVLAFRAYSKNRTCPRIDQLHHLAAKLYFLVLSKSKLQSHQDICRLKARQVSGLPSQVGTLLQAPWPPSSL